MAKTGMVDAWHYTPGPMALAQRTVLIAGATGALGSAVSLACARYGATVVLCGRNVAELEKLYDRIEESGARQPAIIPVDLEGASDTDYQTALDSVNRFDFSSDVYRNVMGGNAVRFLNVG